MKKKRINPVITNSSQEKKGDIFGKKMYYTFTISIPEIKAEVTRTLEDFEFFHDVLVERYPFKYIPSYSQEIKIKHTLMNYTDDTSPDF